MELTHIELSVPTGTFTDRSADPGRLFTDCFGWPGTTRVVAHPKLGKSTEISYEITGKVKLVVREGPNTLEALSDDHLGFSVEPAELDQLLSRCLDLARRDPRVEFQFVEANRASEVDLGEVVFRTFFVRFLLPIWIQFECLATEPSHG